MAVASPAAWELSGVCFGFVWSVTEMAVMLTLSSGFRF